jgi:hypothetical protein
MGCGIKAAYEDEFDRLYKVEVDKYSKKSPEEILEFVGQLEHYVKGLNSWDNIALTRSQFALIDDLSRTIQEFKRDTK